jgi:hypothetical protein
LNDSSPGCCGSRNRRAALSLLIRVRRPRVVIVEVAGQLLAQAFVLLRVMASDHSVGEQFLLDRFWKFGPDMHKRGGERFFKSAFAVRRAGFCHHILPSAGGAQLVAKSDGRIRMALETPAASVKFLGCFEVPRSRRFGVRDLRITLSDEDAPMVRRHLNEPNIKRALGAAVSQGSGIWGYAAGKVWN